MVVLRNLLKLTGALYCLEDGALMDQQWWQVWKAFLILVRHLYLTVCLVAKPLIWSDAEGDHIVIVTSYNLVSNW